MIVVSNSEIFIDKYKQLEKVIKSNFGLSQEEPAVAFLERNPSYGHMKEELRYCRNVRNLLSHNPKIEGEYPVEVSDGMLRFLDKVIKTIEHPKRARDIYVPTNKVLYRTYDDKVLDAMIEMNERNFSKMPILDNGVVVGIFSENTLMSYLVNNKRMEIKDDMTFNELSEYLPLEKHKAHDFLFVGADMMLTEVVAIFDKALDAGKRIGLVLVTNTGKSSEKLLGIISAWEVATR